MSTPTDDTVTLDRSELAQLEHLVETLEEANTDAARMLAAEDRGWRSLLGTSEVLTRDQLLEVAATAQVMAVFDPLVKRAINVRVADMGTPTVSAPEPEHEREQDVNALVRQLWDDPGNADAFTSAQAGEERERARATQGETFHALPTNPRTGRVQVRRIPHREVTEIITDPEDAATPRFYRRVYTALVIEQGYTGSTRTRREMRRVLYPDVNHRPSQRPRSIDGVPVEWDKPVVHTPVNRVDGLPWGVPDATAALAWARGYKLALEDWAKHHKALAAIAYTASVKGRKGAAAVRERMPVQSGEAGQTAILGQDNSLAAVNKSGATLEADAAEPLAGMVAAAMDIPKTMLLADPGVTGARATAETLDQPLMLDRLARRALDDALITTVVQYAIREAVRAPGGQLRGTITRDPSTGREVVALAGEQDMHVDIDRPSLDKTDLKTLIDALSTADGMDLLPPLVLARLLLVALGEDDIDSILSQVTDEDGNHIPPSQTQAVNSALDAVRRGDQPQE